MISLLIPNTGATTSMFTLIMSVIAYLIGSLSTAILICQWLKLPDPRTQGSGNPGATNVLRFAGKRLAIMVLIGDFLKGLAAVGLAKFCGVAPLSLIAFAVVLGHCYPIFFKFQGGKGVATAFGALFGLSFYLGAAMVLTWLLVALAYAYSSLAALTAIVLAPVYTAWFLDSKAAGFICLISLLVVWRHRRNIQNLTAGIETKIGQKPSEPLIK